MTSLPDGFLEWVNDNLVHLLDAGHTYVQAEPSHTSFDELFNSIMAEFEHQPFAEPELTGYTTGGGTGRFTVNVLRRCAERFLREISAKNATQHLLCPVNRCGCLLEPEICSARIEEECNIRNPQNQGEIDTAPVLKNSATRLLIEPKYLRCAHPLCERLLRTAGVCRRNLCMAHCELYLTDCGSDAHDKRRVPALIYDNFPPIPSPFDISSVGNSICMVSPANLLPPEAVSILLDLKGDECHIATFDVLISGWKYDLATMPQEAKVELGWEYILPGSLRYFNHDAKFVEYNGGAVPAIPGSYKSSTSGTVYLRATTLEGLSQFPLFSFDSTVARLRDLSELTTHPFDMTIKDAYAGLFRHEPTEDDLEAIRICRMVYQIAPYAVCKRFEEFDGSFSGSWAGFVQACKTAVPMGTTTPFDSPLAYKQRRPRGRSGPFALPALWESSDWRFYPGRVPL